MNETANLNSSIRSFSEALDLVATNITDQAMRVIRHRLICNARDIITSLEFIIERYDHHKEKTALTSLHSPTSEMIKMHKELDMMLLAVKGFFFYVRSLQDNCYRAMLEFDNEKSGHASMSNCQKNGKNPCNTEITNKIPEYFEWFTKFRDIRTDIKYGISNGSRLKNQSDFSFCFATYTGEYVETKHEITTEYIIESLKMSTELLHLISTKKKKLRPTAR